MCLCANRSVLHIDPFLYITPQRPEPVCHRDIPCILIHAAHAALCYFVTLDFGFKLTQVNEAMNSKRNPPTMSIPNPSRQIQTNLTIACLGRDSWESTDYIYYIYTAMPYTKKLVYDTVTAMGLDEMGYSFILRPQKHFRCF